MAVILAEKITGFFFGVLAGTGNFVSQFPFTPGRLASGVPVVQSSKALVFREVKANSGGADGFESSAVSALAGDSNGHFCQIVTGAFDTG